MNILLCRSVAVLCIVLPAFVLAAKPDDHEERVKAFQTAIKYMQDNQGCLSIPYSDLQDQCQRKQATVNRWCKESGPWNCDDADPKRLQRQLEQLKTERDTLKSNRADLERKKSSATDDNEKRDCDNKIKEIDDKLYELQRTQGNLEKEINDASKTVSDRMYVAKSCRDARPEVMQIFKDAKSRADGERDADIQPLAQQLIKYWESQEPGHDTAIRAAKEAAEKCDRVLYDIGHLGNH